MGINFDYSFDHFGSDFLFPIHNFVSLFLYILDIVPEF